MHRRRLVKGLVIPLLCLPFLSRTASLAQEAYPPEDSSRLFLQHPQKGEVSVEAVLDSPRIPSNRTLTLTIRARCTGDINQYEFQWPGPPDIERFEMTGSSSANIVKDQGGQRVSIKEFRYVLKPVGQGLGRIGSVTLVYTDKITRREYSLSTRPLSVEVTAPAAGESGGISRALLLVLGLFTIGVVGGLVFYLRRSRIRREEVKPLVEAKSPEEIALGKLETIPELQVAGETKEYYSSISNVLRDYIDRKFSLRTMELTTPDIINHLRLRGAEDETLAEIEKILHICDMVKFARHEPSPSDVDHILSAAQDFFTSRVNVSSADAGQGDELDGAS